MDTSSGGFWGVLGGDFWGVLGGDFSLEGFVGMAGLVVRGEGEIEISLELGVGGGVAAVVMMLGDAAWAAA